ncbi:MAG TPA: sigma-70 family RNA polymerase sigma factor [Kofleriaceae bacterium]|nr:sigma-70 family RNA polymerase sigma factor [Kofleriaceae bacterium]
MTGTVATVERLAAFADGLGRSPAELGELAPALEAAIATARAAWPDVALAPEIFARHLGAHLSGHDDVAHALASVRAVDLWLACASGHGDPDALRVLEQRYLPAAARAVARFGDPRGFVADAIQELRERLLVGTPPRIAAYAGNGSLEGWIKVAAVRVAINLRHKEDRRRGDSDEAVERGLVGVQDPELDFIKAQYRGDFSTALRDAFGDLGSDERAMMRFYLIDKLNIAEIGGLFGLSRATVGRRIVDIRAKVFEGTKRRLQERLRIASGELDSLLAIVHSQVDFSLSQVLARSEKQPA